MSGNSLYVLILLTIAARSSTGNLDTCNSTCVMDEVTCTCRPSLRFFNWVIENNNGFLTTIPFANSPNGTIQVRERYSTEALVFYNEDNVITTFLTLTAHPELHSATITCDQYSITFYILELISPALVLNRTSEAEEYTVDIIFSNRNDISLDYSVIIESSLTNMTHIMVDLPAKYKFIANVYYNFTLANRICNRNSTEVYQYRLSCPFYEPRKDVSSSTYYITQNEGTNVTLLQSSDIETVLVCENDSMWNVLESSFQDPTISNDSTYSTPSNLTSSTQPDYILLYVALPITCAIILFLALILFTSLLTSLIYKKYIRSKYSRDESPLNELEDETYQVLNNAYVQARANRLQMATAQVRGEQYSAVNMLNSNTGSHNMENSENNTLHYDTVMNIGISINEETDMAEVVQCDSNNPIDQGPINSCSDSSLLNHVKECSRMNDGDETEPECKPETEAT